ncbi:MAG: hypothetical protein ACWA5K_04355, partial [bacterium]
VSSGSDEAIQPDSDKAAEPETQQGQPARASNDPRKNPRPVAQVQVKTETRTRPLPTPLDTATTAPVVQEQSDHKRPANDPRNKAIPAALQQEASSGGDKQEAAQISSD